MPAIKTGLDTTNPMSFVQYRKTLLIGVNGVDRGIRWEGTPATTAEQLGITAPVSAATIASSGTGAISGTYSAYVRYVDADDFVSDLSPLSNELTTTTATGTITDATNAAPINIESAAHGLSTGNVIRITTVVGNTAANGVHTITVVDADNFTLNSSVGNGEYTAGGTWVSGVGQINYTGIPVSPEARVTGRQVFRNTAGQEDVYYLDLDLADNSTTTGASTKDDDTLAEQTVLPILNPDGTPNANIHGVPPTAAKCVAMLNDRAFYLTDEALYFSEPDLPESVPATSLIYLQSRDRDEDASHGLMHYRGSLFILQKRHIYESTYAKQPAIDMTINLACNRGCINDRSWVIAEGMAYLLDDQGAYRFAGGAPDPIDAPIQNYFRDGTVDFTMRKWFFASYEPLTKVVRFHVAFSGDTRPKRALCYSLVTERWWLEVYAVEMGGAVAVDISSKLRLLMGGSAGVLLTAEGTQDTATDVEWSWVSGMMPFTHDEDCLTREVRVIFSPTASAASMNVSLLMDHNAAAETLQESSDRDSGVTMTAGSTSAVVSLASTRTVGGVTENTPGFAKALTWSERLQDEPQGRRWLRIKLSGSQGTQAIGIYGLEVMGVG